VGTPGLRLHHGSKVTSAGHAGRREIDWDWGNTTSNPNGRLSGCLGKIASIIPFKAFARGMQAVGLDLFLPLPSGSDLRFSGRQHPARPFSKAIDAVKGMRPQQRHTLSGHLKRKRKYPAIGVW